ncbi:MAG: TldE/PmbA family protein [Deltaproteobacteria bacterium]|nr:TldE/PmbA family protein [Deltaproteobacteria bacterium]HCH66875.1 TldE/PmbA family protein [Deltaproteobacteria bacterium]
MRSWFDTLTDHLSAQIRGHEGFTLYLSGESSEFARLNRGRVRQPGHVQQCAVTLRLIDNGRHASQTITLSGDPADDRARLDHAVDNLRGFLPHLPADPHLLVAESVQSSSDAMASALPPAAAMVDDLLKEADGNDLVGIVASGTTVRGFANHHGQRNWFSRSGFNLDWCLVHDADKAVKASLAGFTYDRSALHDEMARARSQLATLARPGRTIEPGAYRAWLTPSALSEIFGVLHWGGFGLKSLETGNSPLRRYWSGEHHLDPRVEVSEDIAHGIAPDFQADGFRRPARTSLFEAGRMTGAMVSPRSAQEFGRSTNGASNGESPVSLSMAAGDIPVGEELARLGTGLYIGNLWYTNFSDRDACRITGMTRFATFWVEDGEIVAPVNVMRFDETLDGLLGAGLEGLSAHAAFLPSNMTYGERSVESNRLPGALVKAMRFTL